MEEPEKELAARANGWSVIRKAAGCLGCPVSETGLALRESGKQQHNTNTALRNCIVAFLGEKNWDRNKVRGLLYLVPLDDDAKALANTDFRLR